MTVILILKEHNKSSKMNLHFISFWIVNMYLALWGMKNMGIFLATEEVES